MRKIFPACCASAEEQSAKSMAPSVRTVIFFFIFFLFSSSSALGGGRGEGQRSQTNGPHPSFLPKGEEEQAGLLLYTPEKGAANISLLINISLPRDRTSKKKILLKNPRNASTRLILGKLSRTENSQ